MKMTPILVGVMLMLTLSLLPGCKMTGKATDSERITLGYCPTMTNYAQKIASTDKFITIRGYPSTHAALSALNTKQIDIALVGRLAKKTELHDITEVRLRGGLTLVGKEKRFIQQSELEESTIHTYVTEDKARKYLPESTNIVYHDSSEKAITNGIDDIVLIDWQDYTDNLELVIPVNHRRNKIEMFRIPVLYTSNKGLIKQLELDKKSD